MFDAAPIDVVCVDDHQALEVFDYGHGPDCIEIEIRAWSRRSDGVWQSKGAVRIPSWWEITGI